MVYLDTKITEEYVDGLLDKSTIEEIRVDPTTVVKVVLPNGYSIVESASCVDSGNCDHALGKKMALRKIKDKIWELESYALQCKIYERDMSWNPHAVDRAKAGAKE